MGTRISVWTKCGWRHSFRALRGACHHPCAQPHRAVCRDSVYDMSKMRSTQFCLELPREFPELGFLRQSPFPLCPPPPFQRVRPRDSAGSTANQAHPRGREHWPLCRGMLLKKLPSQTQDQHSTARTAWKRSVRSPRSEFGRTLNHSGQASRSGRKD